MSKTQVNFRLPDTLLAALKTRAASLGVTSTELAIRLLEQGLGLPSSETFNNSRIEQRITNPLALLDEQLDNRIEQRITTLIAPREQEIEQRIESRIEDVIQSRIDVLLGESNA